MGITSHELHKEFPEYKDRIEELKANDLKFSEKLTRYSELDQEIEGLEQRGGPISDDKMHRLKAWRAQLKDELYQTLTNGK
ncbi:YdcH family protein [Marinobacter sp. DUT-1]|uniref:YdcH family protein n=1 Tax=Marinobacter sp. DUT-1 TaxID=3412037 RepID=UPI003D17D81E